MLHHARVELLGRNLSSVSISGLNFNDVLQIGTSSPIRALSEGAIIKRLLHTNADITAGKAHVGCVDPRDAKAELH